MRKIKKQNICRDGFNELQNTKRKRGVSSITYLIQKQQLNIIQKKMGKWVERIETEDLDL